jgi:hypothetical protein
MKRGRAWRTTLTAWLACAAIGAATAEPRVFDLSIKGGRLPESQRLVRVRQGDEVTLRWTSDRALALHLHGYDLEVKVTPAAPAEMRFAARATGRFPIETHGGGQEHGVIAHLEVHPR